MTSAYKHINIAAIALLAAILLAPALALAEPQPTLNMIEFQGLGRVSSSALMGKLAQRAGEPLDPLLVSDDIKTLFATGYFEDVTALLQVYEGGIKLIYSVKEKPTIRRVDTFGNEDVDDEKLTEKLTIKAGATYDLALIESNAKALRAVLWDEGYPLAVVLPITREIRPGSVLLTFHIKEGPKVKVNAIAFEGNSAMNSNELEDAIESSEWWFMSWLTRGGKYEREEVRGDVKRLLEHYHNNGYLKAEVPEPEIRIHDDKEWVDINFRVREGVQYSLGEVSFRGNTVLSDEEIRKLMKMEQGKPASRKKMTEDVTAVVDKLSENGYALANVRPDVKVNEESRIVDVTYNVSEGDLYHVGRIEISGNHKTRDYVIRREFKLKEGDVFNSARLRKTYQSLMNLNYFEELQMEPRPSPTDKTLGIDVRVKEQGTAVFNIGAGYSTVDKFIGMMDLTFGNLNGRGQTLKLATQFSSSSKTYEISFKEPWLFDKPIAFSASIFDKDKEYDEYTKYSKGFSLGLSRKLGDDWRIGGNYKYELVTIGEIDDEEETDSDILILQGERLTSSVEPFIEWNTLDNNLMPHTGTSIGTSVTYAGIGGDNKFFKWDLESRQMIPLTEKTELSVKARYGYAVGIRGEQLPIYERYYVGSVFTVRGLRDIGPKDSDGDYVGGGQRLIFNFDYTYFLNEEAKLKGSVFYDYGTAFDNLDKTDMRHTAGVGIRWISPIGPLSLEWAKNLFPRDEESGYRWEFMLGTLF